MKSSGPRIDPCWTPHSTHLVSDSTFPILVYSGWSSDRIQALSVPFLVVRSVHIFSAFAHGSLYQKLFLDQKSAFS